MLTLILGGARSGRSGQAQRLATPVARVSYGAAEQTNDDPGMAARIGQHSGGRPPSWRRIEEPPAWTVASLPLLKTDPHRKDIQ